ncbi:MAG: ASCH domain-containing protein [Bacilli bacterium]|nr:ASCH domain-containing protein [Bacilli bacterium]
MKVITVKQPFASLIAAGLKEYEFRTWKINYRGEILIHAGKGIDKKAMKKFEHLGLEYPLGCIIAKANITDCVFIDDDMKRKLKNKDSLVYSGVVNDDSWSGYGFKLGKIEKIEPIKINGQLGLWNYDE